jgi:hypothetical protein
MTDDTPAHNPLPPDSPHAVEVRDAQVAADELGTGSRGTSPPGVDADLALVRRLVATYGADGVRRMIDSVS